MVKALLKVSPHYHKLGFEGMDVYTRVVVLLNVYHPFHSLRLFLGSLCISAVGCLISKKQGACALEILMQERCCNKKSDPPTSLHGWVQWVLCDISCTRAEIYSSKQGIKCARTKLCALPKSRQERAASCSKGHTLAVLRIVIKAWSSLCQLVCFWTLLS